MDSQYLIAWSNRGLERILNLTYHSQKHMLDVLMENPESKYISNPIRDIIVNGVISGKSFEIWQIYSSLSEKEIIDAFETEGESTKQEIRITGELIFAK